jgi:hypothetical protein
MPIKTALFACVMLFASACLAFGQTGDGNDEGHLTIEDPGRLSEGRINEVYRMLGAQMVEGYGLSELPFGREYLEWRVYNRLPYLSATHGNRYVNSYANAAAERYGALKPGERYAVGAVFAKDSFTVTKAGEVFPGALFVMEKLAAGANPDTADWRYVMIMPDGSLFGDSAGDTAAQVAYCHDCHAQRAQDDFVFFVPEAFRRASE